MNLILIGLAVYALIEAINAANRVWQKRRLTHPSFATASTSIEQTDRSTSAQQPTKQPIREPAQRPTKQPIQEPTQQPIRNAESAVNPFDLAFEDAGDESAPVIDASIPSEVETSVPLAISLPVSKVVHPDRNETPSMPDLVATDPDMAEKTERSESEERHTILEEIAQLENREKEDAIAYFSQYLNHPDGAIRVAAVFELGELAVKRQGNEEVVERLNQLSQDADPDVRAQAIAALEKVRF